MKAGAIENQLAIFKDMQISYLLLTIQSVFVLLCERVYSQLAASSFPKFQINLHNNGVSDIGSVTSTSPALKWKYDTEFTTNGDMINGAITTDSNGNLYFTQGPKLYCISSDGRYRWSTPLRSGYFPISTPTVTADGSIYLTAALGDPYNTQASAVSAFYPSGIQKWNFILAGPRVYDSNVNLSPDGQTLYVQSNGRYLQAITTEGRAVWTYDLGDFTGYDLNKIRMTPTVADDGTVIIGSADGFLHAVSSNGNSLWKQTITPFYAFKSAVLDDQNDIYLSVDGGTGFNYNMSIRCFSIDGTPKWTFDVLKSVKEPKEITAPVVSGGVVYFAVDYFVFAIKNGEVLWSFIAFDPAAGYIDIWGPPILDIKSRMIYFGALYFVYGLSLDTGLQVFRARTDTYSTSFTPSIGADGTLYAAAYQKVYAFTN